MFDEVLNCGSLPSCHLTSQMTNSDGCLLFDYPFDYIIFGFEITFSKRLVPNSMNRVVLRKIRLKKTQKILWDGEIACVEIAGAKL